MTAAGWATMLICWTAVLGASSWLIYRTLKK